MTDETLRQNILTDLQSRTQTDAELLAMVEIGNDAAVAAYYNTTEADGQYLDARLSKAALRQSMGDIKAGALMVGLRTYGAGSGTYSALVAEAVIELDAGRLSPNLGNAEIRSILSGLGDAGAFGEDQPSSQAVAAEVLALAPAAMLCHVVAGRPVTHMEVSAALSSVRVNGTVELIENWQTPEGGE